MGEEIYRRRTAAWALARSQPLPAARGKAVGKREAQAPDPQEAAFFLVHTGRPFEFRPVETHTAYAPRAAVLDVVAAAFEAETGSTGSTAVR